jgi:CheY-like chemotaxis protein
MPRVLVIDDDDNVRTMLRMILEGLGHAVLEARDGNEGLALFKSAGADMVVTDLIMPGKEGLETIGELRKANPGLPIIAMSGGQQAQVGINLRISKFLGASAVLVKPFMPDQLEKVVGSLLPQPDTDAGPRTQAHGD